MPFRLIAVLATMPWWIVATWLTPRTATHRARATRELRQPSWGNMVARTGNVQASMKNRSGESCRVWSA